ncbi:hypothetical protein [Pelagibaculum spongiae]|uniref:Uncharacterized protein n=1 Tax=Pelagibaculum spongiae TaxID=2080658 RepID=A0A2V1GTM6_9GAMM|nr:hypothetical protein [Pelagibaculum spongiae]PVZ68364.1 hypothetical protein DC094_13865 [Pelagibaculum spongiae]
MEIKKISLLIGSLLMSSTVLLSFNASATSLSSVDDIPALPEDCRGRICFIWEERASALENLARELDTENNRLQKIISSSQNYDMEDIKANKSACLAEFDIESGQYKLDGTAPDNSAIRCVSQDDFDAFLYERNITLDPTTDFGKVLNRLRDRMAEGASIAKIGDQAQMIVNHTAFGLFRVEALFNLSYFSYAKSENNYYQLYTSFFSPYSSLYQENSLDDFNAINGEMVKKGDGGQFSQGVNDAAELIVEMISEFSGVGSENLN